LIIISSAIDNLSYRPIVYV